MSSISLIQRACLPLAALVFLAAAGCSRHGSSEPDCAAVADKVVTLLKADLARSGSKSEAQDGAQLHGEEHSAIEAQLATIRSAIDDDCSRDREFFAPRAACIMKARSRSDLDACESGTLGETPAGNSE